MNGRGFTPVVLRASLKAAKNSSAPIDLLVENDDYYKTYPINSHGGEQYQHLVRDEAKPHLLTDILKER